ncbi:hypothetical protein B6U91_00475 [Candidatus Pacearchaeota archaeon ex4484_71]|nr:MAG: hypothetical protein B6U91_00475 [Candidatus Pacearchaeota archaeon ex4484_71]
MHNNQSFSLTTGQATPSSQRGYKSRAEPLGKFEIPINPLRLALASGVSFIARANARDPKQTAKIIEKAIQHKGFSFVEIIQDCIIFNLDANNKEERMFLVPGNGKRSKEEASKLIEMYDYDSKKGRIPLGVLFSERRKTFEEQWPQLQELQRKNKGWAEIKK